MEASEFGSGGEIRVVKIRPSSFTSGIRERARNISGYRNSGILGRKRLGLTTRRNTSSLAMEGCTIGQGRKIAHCMPVFVLGGEKR